MASNSASPSTRELAPGLVVIGGLFVISGVIGEALEKIEIDEPEGAIVIGVIAITIGVILDHQNDKLSFSTLTDQQGHDFGLNQIEKENFNQEIDEVNFAVNSLNRLGHELRHLSPKEKRKTLEVAWQDFSQSLSLEAFSALKKISVKLVTNS